MAVKRACRNEPAPLSAVVVTLIVLLHPDATRLMDKMTRHILPGNPKVVAIFMMGGFDSIWLEMRDYQP